MRWWRANWGRVAGELIGQLLIVAALVLAAGVLVGAVRAAVWIAGFGGN